MATDELEQAMYRRSGIYRSAMRIEANIDIAVGTLTGCQSNWRRDRRDIKYS